MADILKVTTPLINRNLMPSAKPTADPTVPFQMVDVGKVNKLNEQKQTLEQNNTLQLQNESASILTGMLNDPDQTVHFLRSIYLLQEVVSMLPIANDTISEEIVKLYESLLLHPEDLVGEMMQQANMTTIFKGELFDALRQILQDVQKIVYQNSENLSKLDKQNGLYELKSDIANFMKAMNQRLGKADVLESIANNLGYLKEEFAGTEVSKKMAELESAFTEIHRWTKSGVNDAIIQSRYVDLKKQVLALLQEIKQSLLYNPKIAKNSSIIQYNLSRYQPEEGALNEALKQVLRYIATPEDQKQFVSLVEQYLARSNLVNLDEQHSTVLKALTEIIEKESSGKHIMNSEQIEKIVQSLLTSPSNFTPLLHFVLPLDFHGIKAFGELWIDPETHSANQEENGSSNNYHILMALDVEVFGRFEVEAKILKNKLALTVFCPPEWVTEFQPLTRELQAVVLRSPYDLSTVRMESLERARSLMEVFEDLPKRRTGIYVKI